MLAVTEDEPEAEAGAEAHEEEGEQSVPFHITRRQRREMRELGTRPQICVLLRLKVTLCFARGLEPLACLIDSVPSQGV